jgi:hypothetical protein
MTEWANLAVTFGNGLLVFGGVYMLYLKIRNTRNAGKAGRRRDDAVS